MEDLVFVSNIDLNGLELKNSSVEKVSSDFTGGDLYKGRVWKNTTDGYLRVYHEGAVRAFKIINGIVENQTGDFTIDGDEDLITVNPGARLATLTIITPAAPEQHAVIEIVFGGTIQDDVVVSNISLSSANPVQGVLPNKIWAGDSFKLMNISNVWYIK